MPMKIEWFGHSCFRINESLVIDPYQDGSVPGLPNLRVSANKVICSHQHADHNGADCVKIVPGDDSAFAITEIPSWHDNQQGALRGPNTIFVIKCENLRVAHLGDLGCKLDDTQKRQLQNLDILMIPVGGFFTIDADQAASIAKELKPKCIIPMHFRGDGFGYDVLGTVDLFAKHFTDAREVGAALEVSNALPEVAVMDFAK